METEAGFEIVRKLNANLADFRRLIRISERLLDDLEGHLNELKEPVES